jgi:hypothetical protein
MAMGELGIWRIGNWRDGNLAKWELAKWEILFGEMGRHQYNIPLSCEHGEVRIAFFNIQTFL